MEMLMNKYPNYDPNKRDKFLEEFEDRGMIRWFGFYLSDHSAALNRQKKLIEKTLNQKHHDQMNFGDVATIISQAVIYQKEVFVETNSVEVIEDDLIDSEPIIGFIEGCTDLGLVICKKEIKYNEINYIQINPNKKC